MSRGGNGHRSFKVSKFKGLVRKIGVIAFVAVNVLSITLTPTSPALAASFTFTQNDWAVSADSSATAGHTDGAAQTGARSFYSTSSSYLTTGADLTIATSSGSFAQTNWSSVNQTTTAAHTTDQTGWTSASTTDSQIDYTGTAGSLKLNITENTLTQTDDTTTQTGFNLSGRSFSNTAVSGTGASASIAFTGTTATPVARGVNDIPAAALSGLAGGNHTSIDAVDASAVYVAHMRRDDNFNYSIAVHKTADGGASWTSGAISGSGPRTYGSLKAVNASTVFVSYIEGLTTLKVGKSVNSGASWTTSTLDTGIGDYQTSIAATDANNVFVSYTTGAILKFAMTANGGTTWATSTVDSVGSVGRHASIEAVADSTPGDGPTIFISYYDTTNTNLKLAKSTDGGTTWTLSTPDGTTGDTGSWSSLEAVDENNVSIAYYRYYSPDPDTAYRHIRVVTSSNGGSTWTTNTAVSAASTTPQYITHKATSASSFLLAYYNAYSGTADLMFTSSADTGATWGAPSTVASSGTIGFYASLDALDANTAFVSYADETNSRMAFAASGYSLTPGTYESGSIDLGGAADITTLALTKTAQGSQIKATGYNDLGQLGDGTTIQRTAPVSTQGSTNVITVAAGGSHSLALLADGKVKGWGKNSYGRLGDGSTTHRTTPVTVCATGAAEGTCDANPLTNVVAIAAGSNHSLALLADGTVKAWGYNASGQLGDGTTTNRTTPVPVPGITTANPAVAIAASESSSYALLADGTVKAWGHNGSGQLGDGSVNQRTTPVSVSGITTANPAVAIAAGGGTSGTKYSAHALALLADGTIRAWGSNQKGELGDANACGTTYCTTPVTVLGISNAVAVAAGGGSNPGVIVGAQGGHSLALLADGTVKGWGYNGYGQIGDGSTTNRTTPVTVCATGAAEGTCDANPLTNVVSIAAGSGSYVPFSLALLADGTVKGWGYNGYGQIGDGSTTNRTTPAQMAHVSNATAITAGSDYSLVITGGARAEIAANNDNATWTYKGVPIQLGRKDNTGLSTLLGSSNRYVKYRLTIGTKSATVAPTTDAVTITYRSYPTGASGYSLVSSPFNTENSTLGIGSVSWNGATTSAASLKFQVRTASSLAGLTSASWCGPTNCSGTDYFVDANNGGAIANTALTDGSNDQWFQYKAILTTTNSGATPQLDEVTVVYNRPLDSVNGYTLVSSPYDSGSTANVIGDVRMNVSALPSGTAAKIQVRTASSQGGLSSATWCGTDCTGSTYFTAAGTGTNTFTSIPSALTDGTNDQWFQYRITLVPSSDNLNAPYVSSASVTYVVNTAPTVTNVTATTAATTQGASGADAGKITVTYDLTDEASETSDTYEAYLFYDVGVTLSSDNTTTLTVSDTSKMPSTGYVQIGTEVVKYGAIVNSTTLGTLTRGSSDLSWPGSAARHTKAYSSGSTVWIKAGAVTGDVGSVTKGTSRTMVWDQRSEAQFASYSKYDAKVRVLVHDGNLANQLSSQGLSSTDSSANVIIDNVAPTFSFTFDAGVAGETGSATVTVTTSGDATSTAQYMIADDAASHSTASSTPWTTFTTPGSKAWTLDTDFEIKTLSVQVRDPYANAAATSTASTIMPAASGAFLVQDVSKIATSDWRLFVGWETATSSDFASYKAEYATSTDNSTFSSYINATTTIASISTNYYVHQSLDTNLYYRYRLGVTAMNGNTSIRSNASTTAKPDGAVNLGEGGGGNDATPPVVTNVASSLKKATSATISFDATDGASGATNAAVYFATQQDFTNNVNLGRTDRDRYTSKLGNPGYLTVATSTPATHTIALTNLTKNMQYRYAAESCDATGNCQFEDASDAGYTFTTQNGPAIVSGSIVATPSFDSASITWKTDKASDSIVFYATTSASSLVSPISVGSNAQVTSADGIGQYVHTVTVPNLTYSATYYYKVRSTDQSASSDSYTQYDESTIRSLTTTTQTPPTITSAAACTTTSSTATIAWTTDQFSTTELSLLSADVGANYFSTVAGAQVAQYPSGTIDNASRTAAGVVTAHSNTFTGLTESTTYYVKVRSLNASGGEASSTLTCATTAKDVVTVGKTIVEVGDVTPPLISSLVIKDIKATSATIAWSTDEPADSLVKHGVTMNYGGLGGSEEMTTVHAVTISGLNSKTAYNFKVMSADQRGNRAYSGDQSFTTLSVQEEALLAKEDLESLKKELEELREKVKTDAARSETLADAVARFKSILRSVSTDVSLSDLEDLTTEITDTISEITQEVVPPAIIGGVPQVDIDSNKVTITWRTNKPAGSLIALVPQDEYDSNAKDPYTMQVGQPREEVTAHVVTVPNLQPATAYHFQIRSQAKVGPEGKSRDFVFETKPELPQILDYSFKRITENSITVAWKTNTLSNSQVRYTPFSNGDLLSKEAKTQGKPEFVKDREVTVTNLPSNTNFLIEITSADVTGASASKVIGTIRTTVDEKAPVISKVRSESTIFPGKTERTQTLIYWETDEPSTSQIFWKEGVGKGDLVEFSKLDQEYTTSHVMVLTSFKPGAVYRFQVESADPSNNKGRSTDFTILTPKKGETVIDLIITNFQDIFGFLKQL